MTVRFRHFLAVFLAGFSVIVIFFLKIYAWYPFFVEHFYSRWIYISISHFLRASIGSWSIPLGDWLFLFSFLFFLFFTIRISLLIWHRKYRSILNIRSLLLAVNIIAYNYIIFNLFWGLNYKRIPLQDQLVLSDIAFNREEIKSFICILEDKLNTLAPMARPFRNECRNFQQAKSLVIAAMDTFKNKEICFPTSDSTLMLAYDNPSIKQSIIGFLLNKLGIAGYHHPFTGEAVINAGIPNILLPAVMLHEISHQLGYPKEEEAALISYIIAHYIKNPLLKYSVYLDAYLSLLFELAATHPSLYKQTMKGISSEVKEDITYFQAYLSHNRYPISRLKTKFYNTFFVFNANMQGIEPKNKELYFIMAYEKLRQQ